MLFLKNFSKRKCDQNRPSWSNFLIVFLTVLKDGTDLIKFNNFNEMDLHKF